MLSKRDPSLQKRGDFMTNFGVLNERDRIRTAFITWIKSLPDPATVRRNRFMDQLDLICPEEGGMTDD